ncbi:M20/M25/M40 family metallo-hydrolase [candidate division KSB1 bacterium]
MKKKIFTWFLLSVCLPGLIYSQSVSKEELFENIRSYVNSNKLNILSEFVELLTIPNVSSDRNNIRKNANFVKQMMERRGISVKIIETAGNPVVYGELKRPEAEKTIMFYVHYDGQPVSPDDWIDSAPFNPVIRPGILIPGSNMPKPIPYPNTNDEIEDNWRIYARSSSDDKTPIIALLSAIDALKQAGLKIKHNLKFIFEGEEEAGSVNLKQFFEENTDLLKSDVLFLCDGPAYFNNKPAVSFGVRGITSIEITVYGPNTSLHSGHYGNWAPNPALKLVKLLSSMKDEEGKVLVEGFYDTVIPLSETEKKAVRSVPNFDNELKERLGFSGTEGGGRSLIEMLQFPSLNIRGLLSGWTGSQARTIIPPTATASIDIRLVKGNDPADMREKVIEHIKKQGYHIVSGDPDQKTRAKYANIAKVRMGGGYRAARLSMDKPISQQIIRNLGFYLENEIVILPGMGGSLPLYYFYDILKTPSIIVSIANFDNNQHQPNENLRLGNLWKGIEMYSAILMMK